MHKRWEYNSALIATILTVATACSSSGGGDDGATALPQGSTIEAVTDSSSAKFVVNGFVTAGRNVSNAFSNGVITNEVINGDSGTVTVNGTSTVIGCGSFSTVCTDYDGDMTYQFVDYRVVGRAPYQAYDVFINGTVNYTWDRRITSASSGHDYEGVNGSGLTIKMIPIEEFIVGYEVVNCQIVINSSTGRLFLSTGESFTVSI